MSAVSMGRGVCRRNLSLLLLGERNHCHPVTTLSTEDSAKPLFQALRWQWVKGMVASDK